MKYFVLFSDYEGYNYSLREFNDEKKALEAVEDLKGSYQNVIVIKGKELQIKTTYSLEE